MDEGLCTTTSDTSYPKVLRDLQTKFKISNQVDLSWSVRVAIDHSMSGRVTTLSQELYIETLLKRFSMEGTMPITTPALSSPILLNLLPLTKLLPLL